MNILINNQNNLSVNTKRFKCVGLLVLLSTLTSFTLSRAMEEEEMVQRKISQEDANRMLFRAETPEDVERALEAGADVNNTKNLGMTALHWACINGLKEVALKLIEKKANVNARDQYGSTSLHLACINNQKEIVKMLIENGADTNKADNYDRTPAQTTRNEEIKTMLDLVSQFIKIQGKFNRDKFIKEKTKSGENKQSNNFWDNVERSNMKLGRIKREPFKLPERTDKYHDMNVITEKEKLDGNENQEN